MECPNCNATIPDKSKMCMKCGFLIEKENIEIAFKRSPKILLHKYFLLLVLLSIIILIGIFNIVRETIINIRITSVSELKIDKTSIHYVNDLYISDGRYYKYMLNDEEKEIYIKLLESIKNYKEGFKLDLSDKKFGYFFESTQYFNKILSALVMDHPELIQYSSVYMSAIEYSKGLNVRITYALNQETTKKALQEMKLILDEIKSKTENMSEIEKVKYVYDYIADNNKYGKKEDLMSQSAYSIFNENESPVCAGYARASQIILQYIGINSLLIDGKLVNELHEWNFVKINNKYYWYDVTQSDSDKYAGFLFNNTDNYKIKYNTLIPKITGRKYLNYAG